MPPINESPGAAGVEALGVDVLAGERDRYRDTESPSDNQAPEKSETVSKNRRGRPSIPVPPAIGAIFNNTTTRRSLHNHFYIVAAIQALGGEEARSRYPWFMGEGRNWRSGILAELGRFAWAFGDAAAVHFADVLLEVYPDGDGATTRHVASVIRLERLRHLTEARP